MTTEHETPLIRAVDDDEDQLISLEAAKAGMSRLTPQPAIFS